MNNINAPAPLNKDKPKLAILATHAIQHFVPVYQRLVSDFGIDLKVFYIAENGVKDSKDPGFSTSFSWDIPLLEGYEYEFVNPGLTVNSFGFREVDCKNINQRISDYAPNYLWINGYWAMSNWRALLGIKRGQQIIYSSDSNLLDQRSGFRRFLKFNIVKFFIERCHHYIAVSEQNERYLLHYGAPADNIQRACYPIDMRRFTSARDKLSVQDRLDIRQRYGIKADDFVVIFSGKLVDYKRPADLIHAIHSIQSRQLALEHSGVTHIDHAQAVVMLMGDGPQREALQVLAKTLGVEANVVITGFVNQSEIPLHMFAADAFALTSSKEPFGAVVSESLPFGLPIIAANKIGAVGDEDSAQPGKNAIVYPWGEVDKLADAIVMLKNNTKMYEQYRQHSLSLVDTNDTKVYCEAILRCMEQA